MQIVPPFQLKEADRHYTKADFEFNIIMLQIAKQGMTAGIRYNKNGRNKHFN